VIAIPPIGPLLRLRFIKRGLSVPLKKSDENFRALAENAYEGILIALGKGEYVYANKRAGEITGYSVSELLKLRIKDLVHPDEFEAIQNSYFSVISEKSFQKKRERRIIHKNGNEIPIEVTIGRTVWEKQVAVVILFRDITERINAEVKIRRDRKRFRNLTEKTSDLIWEVDKDMRYTYVSPKIYDLLGYDPEEINGKTPFDLMPPEEADRVFRIFNNIAASPQPLNCLENLKLHKDGHPVVIETSAIPIFDSDGKFYGYRGISRDITKRKEIEKKLRSSEMQYRALAEKSQVGFWHINMDGHTIYINPAMCSMLEIENPEELHAMTYESFYDEKNQQIIKRELAKRKRGIFSSYQVELIGNKGTKRKVIISGAPLLSSDGKVHSTIGTITDITDQKRAERSFKKARDELEGKVYERTAELKNALEKLKREEEKLTESKLACESLNKELLATNQAVLVLAKNMEREKEELEKKNYEICTSKLMPILKKLQKDVHCKKREADLELVINYLNEMIHLSPPIHDISLNLTEQEMRVAMLIKNGLTSQKIADMLCISMLTVKTHRRNIRKKLNIHNKDINLVSYLKSKMNAQD
jgi:PAS domain S-box-containing protein